MTFLPVPTVGRSDPRWNDGKFPQFAPDFWRGDVWPPTNYQISCGLKLYGFPELASRIVDRTIANALKRGVAEKYQCDSGKPSGVPFLGMSATLVTLMLDGLSPTYKLPLRDATL